MPRSLATLHALGFRQAPPKALQPRRWMRKFVETLVTDASDRASQDKDFKESDRIRDELAAMGVVLKDYQGRHHLGDRPMSAQAHPKLALRPFLPADAPLLRGNLPRQHRGTDRRRL